MDHLDKLYQAYNAAPEIFHAGRYWKAYEAKIVYEVKNADYSELRSGKYPIFSTFGFNDLVYHYHPTMPAYVKLARQVVRNLLIDNRASLPYSLRLEDIREMAYQYTKAQGELAQAPGIETVATSLYGNPQDVFSLKASRTPLSF